MKPKFVYVVTTMEFGVKYINKKRSPDGRYHSYFKRTSPSQSPYFTIIDLRTWGWYNKFEHAEEAVLHNATDMYEGCYSHALIEKVAEGVLHGGILSEDHWYKWKGSWKKGGYKPAKKPKEYDNVVEFMDQIKQANEKQHGK